MTTDDRQHNANDPDCSLETNGECEGSKCPLPPLKKGQDKSSGASSTSGASSGKARGDAAEGKDDPNTENDGDNGPGSD